MSNAEKIMIDVTEEEYLGELASGCKKMKYLNREGTDLNVVDF